MFNLCIHQAKADLQYSCNSTCGLLASCKQTACRKVQILHHICTTIEHPKTQSDRSDPENAQMMSESLSTICNLYTKFLDFNKSCLETKIC